MTRESYRKIRGAWTRTPDARLYIRTVMLVAQPNQIEKKRTRMTELLFFKLIKN